MGRVTETPVPQSSAQIPSQPPPPQDAYLGHNDQHMNHPPDTRAYVHQAPENLPPPEAYQPPKPPTYPAQQTPETYPPQQPQAAYAPHAGPIAFPPQPPPEPYPLPQPQAAYAPHAGPTAFPPQPPPEPNPHQQPPVASTINTQIYNYNAAPPQAPNYGVPQNGVPIGVQGVAHTLEWTTGLLDCLDDPGNAILTLCCPCVTFGQIAEILDNGETSCAECAFFYSLVAAAIGTPCIISCSYRTKLRNRYGLMGSGPDWAIHCLCEYCALCQEYRELKNRGMDPAIGWQGNLLKTQQANYAMTPPMNQTMK